MSPAAGRKPDPAAAAGGEEPREAIVDRACAWLASLPVTGAFLTSTITVAALLCVHWSLRP